MTFDQVRDLAQVSARQLHYWTAKGWIRPTNPRCGSGHAYTYTHDEAAIAVKMARLVRARLHPEAAAQVARGRSEVAPGVTVLVGEVP